MTDRQYSAGTVDHSARASKLFAADGKKIGHGTIAWLPAPAYEMHAAPLWRPSGTPPMIALLDTGVQPHPWLPDGGDRQFLVKAEDFGWQSPVPDDDTATDAEENYRSHWGHATFIAGLIRLAAPEAQVLSMRVMSSDGKVREDDAASALTWLADNPGLPGDVEVVLMAFGRLDEPSDADLEKLRTPIKRLTDQGVRIVASAGNDGSERPVYPAAFAAEEALSPRSRRSVISVGALATPTERAPYSNSGPWVTEWYRGTNVISIMPLTTKDSEMAPAQSEAPAEGNGYAWWSGTSFAAAIAAGKALPEPASAA
ncbi:MAG TPA: S8 family serine peptidase [Streptosporangiaceae bacterium]|nr:S8 family serine peptidase [Streptosporangiaceae bacterium]